MTKENKISEISKQGTVIKNTGSWYQVKTVEGEVIDCKIKGNFRLKEIKSTNPVAVGDHVHIIPNQEGTAFIVEIEDRKNYIIRRSSNLSKQSHILAANLDLCMLIVTINYPETSTTFIDRFLASAEAYRIPVKLIFNKIDRYDEDELRYMEALISLYTHIGYPCFKISALNNEGIEAVREDLAHKVTLFSGHSGVGKSTLINKILPDVNVRTAEISSYHKKGMHTTTFSEMFELPQGGYIIDTPGIKGFGTFDMNEGEIGHYFPEIFKTSADCRFNNCTHQKEPGCAVREAVEKYYISESRYTSYLNILEDMEEGKYRAAY
ncbi:ribosome small subunit-dependent GTPase A [Bacteroides sp. 224]|uniref:ribosome small subunit-dependent GTPase A n=1 Tax=Bacteroides sp. 224 TaxID=2302936 RepID=UPI0013CFA1C4|nr:ribosome small subunit-dependent GTPase A [Bacteroides sp. 224]NDV65273.1 ribosome small subunit-dependent GTPase A [Bacteroides sp. 224]